MVTGVAVSQKIYKMLLREKSVGESQLSVHWPAEVQPKVHGKLARMEQSGWMKLSFRFAVNQSPES
jgi:hypothetical protein